MAKVAFISLYDRNAYGQRIMCASLKRHGHECRMIFLKRYNTNPTTEIEGLLEDEYPWMGVNKRGQVFKYASSSQISEVELDLLAELLDRLQPDIIGITVNTPLRIQANKVTRFLKQHFNVPILWGGYDPTVNANDCLALADYVCIGEGDQAILDVADCLDRGESFEHVPNLAYLRDGRIVMNQKYPAEQNLDSYPWRDNEPDKFFIEDNRLEENHPALNDRAVGTYDTMSARGCPYKCTYCCEATLKELYTGEKFLRRRSPEDIVNELAEAKERFALHTIHFHDEIFAMDVKWLKRFVPLYKQRVDLPFIAYIYPTRQNEEILSLMKHAGLIYCCLALESGSERLNKEVFQRVYDRELFIQAARILRQKRIRFYTDVITYSPYEEEEDLEKTLDVLVCLGEAVRDKYDIWINKLFVLPGTKLARKMEQDGMVIADSPKDKMFNYYCRLFWIAASTPHSRALIQRLRQFELFREQPWLLNPEKVEAWVESHGPRYIPLLEPDAIIDEQAAVSATADAATLC